VDDLVSKINGYQRGTTTKLAYQSNNSNVIEKPGQEEIVQNDTHVVSAVNNDTPIISDEEIGLNKAINTVKEKIADGMVKSKTIQLDQAGYEIQVVKNGIMSRIVDLDKQINRLLPRIKEVIKEGDEEEFIIQNEKGKKPVKIGKIAVGKTITPGQDQIVVTVKKKNPKPSDGGRK
jgi:PII-like signaling protein